MSNLTDAEVVTLLRGSLDIQRRRHLFELHQEQFESRTEGWQGQ
jgi:hypothetical protein